MNLDSLNNKSDQELEDIANALQSLSDHNKYNKLANVFPDTGPLRRELYKPAMDFLKKGSTHRFRVYMGGNRSGKSFTTLVELTYHLTGLYPSWWEGKKFKKITTAWIIAESGALFRDSAQRLLFGEAGEDLGTGLIPLAEKNNGVGLINTYAMPGPGGGAIGSAQIKHKSGCTVSLIVKTNEMQREQFQAAKVDVILFDEEPREDIYTECLMRLMSIGQNKEPGIAMLAFTPLKGLSEVVLKFLPNGQFPTSGSPIENPDQYICRVEQDTVPHLSKTEIEVLSQQVPKNEREARRKGIPTLGSGRIYSVDEDLVVVKPFAIPDYFPRAYGLDFGWHKTAVIWGAKDPSTDDLYLYAEYYRGEEIPSIHALNIQAKGGWIPGINDPAGGGRDSGGKMVVDIYRGLGLELTDGDNAVEAGLARVLDMFERGKLKIFSTLANTLNELRVYRYDKSNPNKPAKNQADHLMDAIKYLTSMFDWVAVSKNDADNQDRREERPYKSNRDSLTGY